MIRWLTELFFRKRVSYQWLVDNDRREWTAGFEGVNWHWPIKNSKE
jgi:hypothetical protein